MNPDSQLLRGAVIIAAVFLLQEGLLRGFRIDGVRPDLLLGLAIAAGIAAGPREGAILGFLGGTVTDLFVNTPFGLTALVACVVAFMAGSIQQTVGASSRWTVPFLTALASATAVVAWALLGTVLGLPGLLHPHLGVVMAVVATVNGAAALPFARAVRWAFADTTPRAVPKGFAA